MQLEQSMIHSPQNILELFKQILDSSDFGHCAALGVGEQNRAEVLVQLFRAQPGGKPMLSRERVNTHMYQNRDRGEDASFPPPFPPHFNESRNRLYPTLIFELRTPSRLSRGDSEPSSDTL